MYEKLNKWEEALEAYRARLQHEQALVLYCPFAVTAHSRYTRALTFENGCQGTEALEGCMRCLHALGEWEELQDMAQVKLEGFGGAVSGFGFAG